MKSFSEYPLITFAVLSFNQENFIREAVQGALAQTYSPLEIILSDDCSTDRTFEIMEKTASSYNGPHKIVLNRNSKNLGVGDHVNHIMELARGDLIVGAAGDDISHPERTQILCEKWLEQDRKPTSIHSDYGVIDENGSMIKNSRRKSSFSGSRSSGIEDIKNFMGGKHPANFILGATHAWSNQLFKDMPALRSNLFFEDKVIGFRSLVTGGFAYVPQKLVYYRMHSDNLTGRSYNDMPLTKRFRKRLLHESLNCFRFIAVYENYSKDIQTFKKKGILSQNEESILLDEIDVLKKLKHREADIYSGSLLILLIWFINRLIFHRERSTTLKATILFLKRIIGIDSKKFISD